MKEREDRDEELEIAKKSKAEHTVLDGVCTAQGTGGLNSEQRVQGPHL